MPDKLNENRDSGQEQKALQFSEDLKKLQQEVDSFKESFDQTEELGDLQTEVLQKIEKNLNKLEAIIQKTDQENLSSQEHDKILNDAKKNLDILKQTRAGLYVLSSEMKAKNLKILQERVAENPDRSPVAGKGIMQSVITVQQIREGQPDIHPVARWMQSLLKSMKI